MNFKTLNPGPKYPDVLVTRDKDENGFEIVKLIAFGKQDGESDMICSENIKFESMEMAKSFVEDFSEESAARWCKKERLKY